MVQNLFVLLLLSPKVVLLQLLLCLQDSNAMTVQNFRPVKGLSRILPLRQDRISGKRHVSAIGGGMCDFESDRSYY
jgi:hypothetical protein